MRLGRPSYSSVRSARRLPMKSTQVGRPLGVPLRAHRPPPSISASVPVLGQTSPRRRSSAAHGRGPGTVGMSNEGFEVRRRSRTSTSNPRTPPPPIEGSGHRSDKHRIDVLYLRSQSRSRKVRNPALWTRQGHYTQSSNAAQHLAPARSPRLEVLTSKYLM